MDTRTETKLIIELKLGSKKALGSIYDAYASELYAYCVCLTKRREDAEEIVQDVFMQLWLDRTKIRSEHTLRNLLYIMAKHRLINSFRATVNAPVFEAYTSYTDTIISPDAEPMEYDEFYRLFLKAIKRLPLKQQKIVRMSKIRHLSNKEIAHTLSLSEQTVKNQLSTGMKQLRAMLLKLMTLLIIIQQSLILLIISYNQIYS